MVKFQRLNIFKIDANLKPGLAGVHDHSRSRQHACVCAQGVALGGSPTIKQRISRDLQGGQGMQGGGGVGGTGMSPGSNPSDVHGNQVGATPRSTGCQPIFRMCFLCLG